MVRKISWGHDQTISASQATQLLQGGLQFTLSRSLEAGLQTANPQVVQVWMEPLISSDNQSRTAPQAILTLPGRLRITPQTISWTTISTPSELKATIQLGRIVIRLHCGALFDANKKQFSATLAPLLGLQGTILPGGVFESWFLIA